MGRKGTTKNVKGAKGLKNGHFFFAPFRVFRSFFVSHGLASTAVLIVPIVEAVRICYYFSVHFKQRM